MCGIFAMFLNRPLCEEDITGAHRVLAEIAHRGPDAQGEWMDMARGVYLGHRRLSIIDLSHASDQPILRGGRVMVFNGELYNYRDLRTNLQRHGVTFESRGDGEVLLRGIEHWGIKMFDRTDGMFALAQWDGRCGLLAVDGFGEKPLFVAQTADGVYVCSEIAPLARLLRLTPRAEAEDWAAYLSLGFIPPPRTFYAEIEMLLPGSWREVIDGHLGCNHRHWEPPIAIPGRGAPRPVPERELDVLNTALSESLARRMIADVPLTLFLSSGVDSSLVAALCRHELNQNVHCLTVAFQGQEGMRDEAPMARRIASYLGFEHTVIDNDIVGVNVSQLVDLLGQPTGTVGALPLAHVSASARNVGFKVALTGMGGDEITAGYAKHAYVWRLRKLFAAPIALRCPIGRMLRLLTRRGRGISSLMCATGPEVYLAVKNYPMLEWLRSLPGYTGWVNREFFDFRQPEFSIPRYEMTKVMPAVQLLISDHVSMRHGLELRTPFLSRKVVEVIANWDPRALIAFGQKGILRRVLARYLPPELTEHPKIGFSFPRNILVQDEPPANMPGLDDAYLISLWLQREENAGWQNIATRMTVAKEFFRNSGFYL